MTISKKSKAYIIAGFTILIFLFLFTIYARDFNILKDTSHNQQITGTGFDYIYALDGDPTTSWKGLSTYNSYAKIQIKYDKPVIFKGIKILATAKYFDVAYIFDLKVSDTGGLYDDLLPGVQTDYFKGQRWFTYEFVPVRTQYIEFGAKVTGGASPFEINEIQFIVEEAI